MSQFDTVLRFFRHLRPFSPHLNNPRIARRRTSRLGSGDALGLAVFERMGTVELGAVVVVPASGDIRAIQDIQFQDTQLHVSAATDNERPLYSSRMPILGNDVLQSWVDRVRRLGVRDLWLTSSAVTSSPAEASATWFGLRDFARQGIERLLMITLKSYAEMDLADLLRFHCETRNPLTEAHDNQGQLGVCLIDRRALHATGEKCEFPGASGTGTRMPYQFSGYAKRLLSARERQELVGDALTGACAMRPFGEQIREQVWVGEGVSLADSTRVVGPSYIGDRTVVRAGATIGPFAAVERDCVVDCGTTVERSTVLPHTYLAPGLLICHSLVDGGYLEDLNWGAVVDLQPAGLGSRIQSHKSRRQAGAETNGSSRADSAFAWDVTPSSNAPSWLQVEL